MTLLAAALSLSLSAPSACGLPPLAERPWAPGEVLSYDVDVMGIVKAGVVQLAAARPILGGSQLPFHARLRNTSVFAKVHDVKGTAVSFVDAQTLLPQRFRDDVWQDGQRRTTDTRLDRPGPTVRMHWTAGARSGVTSFRRERQVLDLLSTVYYLRAAALQPGVEICFDLLANRRYWRAKGKWASGTEKVDTPAGTYETVRFDARLARADDPAKTRPLHLWFSADRRRLLVAAVSEVDLGPVRAMLTRAWEPRE